jgi:hypothetical protein
LSGSDWHRPWRSVTKARHEWCEALEVRILRNEGDALFAARGRYQRVIQQRRVFLQELPSFAVGDGRESTTAGNEGGGGGREDAPATLKWFEDPLLHVAGRFTP